MSKGDDVVTTQKHCARNREANVGCPSNSHDSNSYAIVYVGWRDRTSHQTTRFLEQAVRILEQPHDGVDF